jgi:hypothetical protein
MQSLQKNIGIVNAIVAVIVFDGHTTKIPTELLKSTLSHDSLACSQTCLTFNVNKVGCSIIVDCTTMETLFGPLVTITRKTITGSFDHKLICKNRVSGSILIELQNAFLLLESTRGLDLGKA